MAVIDLVMPKMGESIMEATILSWTKNVGDQIEEDETILEIATDKVDSEIPSPVDGVITEILFQENDVVAVGTVIAKISTESGENSTPAPTKAEEKPAEAPVVEKEPTATPQRTTEEVIKISNADSNKFYSPLVKNIAAKEGVSIEELDAINGTGANGRVSKKDLLSYIENRTAGTTAETFTETNLKASITQNPRPTKPVQAPPKAPANADLSNDGNVEIIQMDRMRKLIADHMVMSKHTSPHVTSFVEADVTNLVNWRNSIKGEFQKKYGEKITFTPVFIEAVVKAITDFPLINVSVDGTNIVRKKDINIGMATALPSGNLIVPVIKNANGLNLVGLTKMVNGLANKARTNKLKPEDIQDGTFTLTNVGTFGNVMGTPIINQPQVAIMATGAIRKKPAVLETEHGDVIAIRHMMFLSLSYDHRVVDGFLGGSFLRKVADYLEDFDHKQTV